uniref:Uncharacterized protein n=1 Tax=Rhizobium rhizogenes TaxID=359 RepID=A0A7S5DQZ7_RHIRH|nr:hypothetical protein pC5.8d_755 [Rhizobium rhizogenes]
MLDTIAVGASGAAATPAPIEINPRMNNPAAPDLNADIVKVSRQI